MSRIAAILTLLLAAIPLTAQQAPHTQFGEKVDVNVVLVDAIVTDSTGHQILGLDKNDFVVTENGQPQKIESIDYFTNRKLLNATEQNAADAEREAVRVKSMRFLSGRIGDTMPGVVTGFLRHGFFVELDEIPVEGFVRVSLYLDDHFVLDDSGVRMTGRRTRRRFCLGDAVQVIVARVDVAARECDFGLDVPARRGRGRRHHGRG